MNNSPAGQTCGAYAGAYAQASGGYLQDPNATGNCNYCQYQSGDTFLAGINTSYSERARNIGIYVSLIPYIFRWFSLLILDPSGLLHCVQRHHHLGCEQVLEVVSQTD